MTLRRSEIRLPLLGPQQEMPGRPQQARRGYRERARVAGMDSGMDYNYV